MGASKDVGNGESATPTNIFKAIPAFLHSTTSSVGALVPGGGLCYKNHMQNGVPLHVLPIMLVKATDSTSNALKGASKVIKRSCQTLVMFADVLWERC